MSILDKISKPISSISPLNEIPQKKVSPLAPLVKTNPVVNQSVASYIAKPVQEAVIPNFSTKPLSSDISPITSKSTPAYAPEAKGIDPFKLVPGAVAIGQSIEQRSLKPIVEQTKDAMAQQIGYKKDESGKYVKGTLEEQVQATQNFVSGVVGGPAGATRSAINARKIAQSVEEDVISKVLREEVPTLAEAESNAFAKVFKDISNEEDVMTAINRIKTQKKTPYKNTDEFVRAKGIDPASVNVIDNEKFIVESTSGKKAVLTELPISSFGKPKFKTLNQPTYTAGRKITDPIEVTIYNGELRISDGANRFTQAVANGDETIPVVIENFDGSIPTESQLADIRKQANTSSQPKAPVYEGEKITLNSLDNIENDIPIETAINAHRGTSFTPEKRGEARIKEYVETLKNHYNKLFPLANSVEKQKILEDMFSTFREGFKKRKLDILNTESRTISPMISGRGNFPVSRNNKILESLDNKYKELTDFEEKTINKIKNTLSIKTINEKQSTLDQLKKDQLNMKEANKIIKKGGDLKTMTDALKGLGYDDKTIVELITGDFAGRKGFPPFRLTSINNKIKTLTEAINKENISSISDVTPPGYGPNTPTEAEKPILETLRGETPDEAIARKIGYQIDNGTVKLSESPDGWKAVVNIGSEEPKIIQAFKKQDVLNEVFKELNLGYVVAKKEPADFSTGTDIKSVSQTAEEVIKEVNQSGKSIPTDIKTAMKGQNYTVSRVSIDNILKNDLDVKEFVDQYKGSGAKESKTPIIIGEWQGNKNAVMDGWHRLAALKKGGAKEVEAYLSDKSQLLDRNTDSEQRLVEATKDLPVQKMETGFKSIDEIMPSFEKENRELTELYAQEDSGVAREVSDITNLIDNKDKAKAHIDSLKMEIAISKEFILDNPARQLSKYANKRTGELPEVTGNPTSIFAQKGDDIVTQLGFNSSEEARAAYQKYIENRERYLKTKKNINEVAKDFTEKKQILEAVTKKLRKEGMDRKRRIDSIQEFFNLTDAEMKQVTKGMPDYRLMTEERFNNILKGLEGKAFEAFQLSEARTKVEYTIFDKELIKVDNLLKALKLPEIKNMTRKQLLQLNELMRSFKQGDEFLGVRQLETVVNTDIAGVKTKREVLEDLAKRTGVPYSELMRINVRWFDQYLYDVALANRSPFHKIMVEDTSKAMASANVRYFEFKEKMNFLMARARASKARTFVDRLIPTDDMIFDWLDSDSATKLTLASKMTGDELTAARFIQDKYSQVRDYLVSKGQLDRYRTDYITHIERGFLEAMRDAVRPKYINGKRISTDTFISRTIKGVFQGMKEMFTEYKQQEAVFNIMNQKTGEVLPLEKFFRFSMKRTGNLTPTKNVSKAVLSYMQAFEKKVALDSIVPKIDIYAHSITPNGMTKRGLELDDSIKRFVKEWLNTKRGRVVDTRIVVPGGPVDWAIRSAIAFTRLLDLGINVPTGLASNIGEQVMTVINIGFQKTALGATRALTPQGRKISQKYAGFVGERVIDKVRDTSKDIGDRFTETVFGLFSDASRRANIEHLLGSMTPQEFAKGEISAERLGQLRLEIGKYRVIDGGESIIGKTALGKAFTQYKSWAVGTLYSSIHNINVLQKMLRSKQNPVSSKEFQELLRATLMLSFVALTTYGVYSRLRDKKDRSFLEQLAFKSMNDSLSMIGALNPSLWLGVPRITSFLADLSLSLANISMSLVTGERTKQDKEIKGMSKLKATLTPSVVRSIKSIPFEDLMPKKPDAKLQGIKLVPRKKTDLNLKKKNKLEGIKLVPKKNKPIQLQ